MSKAKKSVLFVCIENSSRSQIAEGFAKSLGLEAESAGTLPSTYVNPLVVQAMLEKGIDTSHNVPKALTPETIDRADVVVLTDVSIEDSFPRKIKGRMRKKLVRWSIPDLQREPIEGIRLVRDEIELKVIELASKL